MSAYTRDQANEEAASLAVMLESPGWKVLVDEATLRTDKLKDLLVWENDSERKSELQANIRSFIFLLRFPQELMEAAGRANEDSTEPS